MNGSDRIRMRLATHHTRIPRDRDQRDPDPRGEHADPQTDGHRHRQDQRRERQDRVHEPHRHAVACPAHRAGHHSDDSAYDRAGERDDQREQERYPGAACDPGEHVASELVGAHRMGRRRRRQRIEQVLSVGALAPDDRGEDREQDEESEHGDRRPKAGIADDGTTRPGQPPRAGGRAPGVERTLRREPSKLIRSDRNRSGAHDPPSNLVRYTLRVFGILRVAGGEAQGATRGRRPVR